MNIRDRDRIAYQLLAPGQRVLLAALSAKKSFTPDELSDQLEVHRNTAATTLRRYHYLFTTEPGFTGRRGGQPNLWVPKPGAFKTWLRENGVEMGSNGNE